ncbi:uncharacterized protein LOC142167194 [Nicotiana tabacum]|uniref:Uncharacterized protein LOC142167194 n=1 Tax=Nicotiana tabacum TaxID=4097 RepID=A0AC58SEP7_TOBAC
MIRIEDDQLSSSVSSKGRNRDRNQERFKSDVDTDQRSSRGFFQPYKRDDERGNKGFQSSDRFSSYRRMDHDMTGIPLEAAIHKLSLDPNFPPVRQKKRSIAEVENRLMNAEATYQRLANKMFEQNISKTMEVYIDDMLVKSSNEGDHLNHLQETFDILKKYNMKLNASLELVPPTFVVKTEQNGATVNISGGFGSNGKFCSVLRGGRYCEVNSTNLIWDWINEFIDYLRHGKLLEDRKASRALRTKATCYCFVDGQLYRRVFQGPLARCLGTSETDGVMREVHEEVCGNHTGADSWVLTFIRAGYYWPQMEQEAKTFVQKCDKCQRHAQLVHPPAERLHLVILPWPFIKWGMDIVGPLPQGPGQFGIPKEITCDNGPQFIDSKVTKFLEGLKIKQITSSPYHPSANEKEESTNKIIIQNLKKKLEDAKGNWQMSYRVCCGHIEKMMKSATGETSFSLMYGAEALILMDIRELTIRYSQANEEVNNETLLIKLDLLEEHQNLAYMRVVAQKQRMERYYERRENLQYFKIRDLVLRKVTQISREVNTGKLGPMWEGPYWISAITGKGSYQLGNQNVVKLPSNWNVTQKVFNEASM